MIRHSPCERYIKYLLVHPDGYSIQQIRNILSLQQLDFIGESYVARLREQLVIPQPFYPFNVRHAQSSRFLLQHNIRPLFHPDADMTAATSILEQPRAKENIETMLLSRSPYAWIANTLKRMGVYATTRVVELYKGYYWNVDLLDSTEMRATLSLRTWCDAGDTDSAAQFAALSKANWQDPRVAAAAMPISSLSTMLHLMRMGYMPGNADLRRLVSAARMTATVRSLEAAMRGGYEDSTKGRDYAVMAKTMNEILESIGSPEEDLQHQLTMMLRTDESSPPNIHQLTEGEHTTDMQPQLTVEAEGVDFDVNTQK